MNASATSPSSPTSTTASPRSPTASSSTGAVSDREAQEQLLDSMDLERERGITIKASAVTVEYRHDGEDVHAQLHRHARARRLLLRGLPGAGRLRGRAAGRRRRPGRRGADRRQRLPRGRGGPRAHPRPQQDRPARRRARTRPRWRSSRSSASTRRGLHRRISAKTGEGIDELLDAICRRCPRRGDPDAAARALIFDSVYDDYRGVIVYVRVVDGSLRKGDRILMMGHRPRTTRSTSSAHTPSRSRRSPRGRRGRLHGRGDQDPGRRPVGDTITIDKPRRRPCRATRSPSRWCSATSTPPRRAGKGDDAARRSREAPAERRLVHVPARALRGPGLRLPLRLPGPAAHGDRPGAARARVGVEIVQTAPTVTTRSGS
jgi:hypothetical protein